MKILNLISILLIVSLILSCSNDKEDETDNKPTSGSLGEVGSLWNVKVDNTHDLSIEILEQEGTVFTAEVSYAKFVNKELKFGYTGNEIVDYVYGQGDISKPFTMVKFDAQVGDVYNANIGGNFHYREVVEKQTYHVDCLGKDLEMIGVYEEVPEGVPNTHFGFEIESIVWYWHQEYGLVCVEFYTTDGEFYEVEFVKITL